MATTKQATHAGCGSKPMPKKKKPHSVATMIGKAAADKSAAGLGFANTVLPPALALGTYGALSGLGSGLFTGAITKDPETNRRFSGRNALGTGGAGALLGGGLGLGAGGLLGLLTLLAARRGGSTGPIQWKGLGSGYGAKTAAKQADVPLMPTLVGAGLGGLGGAGLGAGLGALSGAFTNNPEGEEPGNDQIRRKAKVLALLGGLVGAGAGGLYGSGQVQDYLGRQ